MTEKKPFDSLARRYLFKLLANAFSVPLYLVMEAILPRALGPSQYGVFSYTTSMFQYLLNFLDGGTSSCLFNLMARGRDWAVVLFYRNFSLMLLALVLVVAGFGFLPVADAVIMPDIPRWTLPLAGLWAYFTWAGRVLRGVNDAMGNTTDSEKVRMLASVAGLIVLVVLFAMNVLSLFVLFWQQISYLAFMCAGFGWFVIRYWEGEKKRPNAQEKLACRGEFVRFSAPIFVNGVVSALALMAERWLLQHFDGNVQQGYFGLSQKVGIACFLFISAMVPLVMREFSIAFNRKDLRLMAELYDRFGPMLFSLAAYFACFVAFEAAFIVQLFGGVEFVGAIAAVQIMSLYPVHQGYGQLTTSAFYAAGRTRSVLWVSIVVNVLGLVFAYIVIAPPSGGGLNLGALGLAVKSVAMQIVSVTIMIGLLSKIIPISFWRTLGQQILCVLVMGGLAWAAVHTGTFFSTGISTLDFVIHGIMYTMAVAVVAFLVPQAFGLRGTDIQKIITLARRVLRR